MLSLASVSDWSSNAQTSVGIRRIAPGTVRNNFLVFGGEKFMLRTTLFGSVILGGVSVASATVISIPATKDAMIFGTSANADTNMSSGKGPGMFAGADGSLNRKRSLIQFDIAGNVPSGAQITSATLTLILGQVAGS